MGVNGKEGLSKEIVKAIIDYHRVIKRINSESCVKLAMRLVLSKITGLVAF